MNWYFYLLHFGSYTNHVLGKNILLGNRLFLGYKAGYQYADNAWGICVRQYLCTPSIKGFDDGST